MGGLMSVTDLPGQGPVRIGIPITYLSAGLYLAIGVLIALLEREISGQGQWVDTSSLEAQLAMLDFQGAALDHGRPCAAPGRQQPPDQRADRSLRHRRRSHQHRDRRRYDV